MRDYQKTGKIRKIMESRLALGVFAIILIAFSYTIFNLLQKMEDTKTNKEIAETRVGDLEARKVKLTEDIASLNTQEGIEESIRTRFGLAEEGEKMIIIVNDEDDQAKDQKGNKFVEFFTGWWKQD